MRTILLLAANPIGTALLRLAQEERDIREALDRARLRDKFRIESRGAVRDKDIRRGLLDLEPQIIHFCGHGEGERGLYIEDEYGKPKLISGEALNNLFELFPNIECVVLNNCYSEAQAAVISQTIPYVIGMNQSITDKAAIEFSIGFYDGLGAGKSFKDSYKIGCNAIQLAGFSNHLTPTLKEKSSIQNKQQNSNFTAMKNKITEIFISYADADEKLCQELETQLYGLQQDKNIRIWHAGKILAGSIWQNELSNYINSANLILCLISRNYFSEERSKFELQTLIERYQKGILIIPVIFKATDWQSSPLGKLAPIPKNGKPILPSRNRDGDLLKIVSGIRERIQNQL